MPRSKHALHKLALLFSLTVSLALSACGQASEKADGSIDGSQGGPADYIGLYQLAGHEGDAPFTLAEISRSDSGYMYLYDGESLVADSSIDYSEQRALNGNPLMVISFPAGDGTSEIGISVSFVEARAELHMRGYGDLEGFEGTFAEIDGTMFLHSEDNASDCLLNQLQGLGYDLEGTAVIAEGGDENAVLPGRDLSKWFFAWGRNAVDKFTAEKHFAVTAARQVWEYDVLSDEWTPLNKYI